MAQLIIACKYDFFCAGDFSYASTVSSYSIVFVLYTTYNALRDAIERGRAIVCATIVNVYMERPFARVFGRKKEAPPISEGPNPEAALPDLISRREELITLMEQDPHPADKQLLAELEEKILKRGGTL